jgi:hypothetical protein
MSLCKRNATVVLILSLEITHFQSIESTSFLINFNITFTTKKKKKSNAIGTQESWANFY